MTRSFGKTIDWLLFAALLPILGAGLITMKSFSPDPSSAELFFNKQIIWVLISFILFFSLAHLDFRFLKRTDLLVALFFISCAMLLILLVSGHTVRGSASWFSFGSFSFQPADAAKLVLILILAKYFSRRHVEIRAAKHILISGLYAFLPLVLIFFQPDFGSAAIIFLIWLGVAIVAGISKKHLLVMFLIGALLFGGLWSFVFKDSQKDRIRTFLNPLTDVHNSGWNAYQSMIAVGSGQILGKGVGFGTQSRLKFLPEYQTDFIFAAFAEEWGFGGVVLLLILYGVVIWRILASTLVGSGNFEIFFGVGLSIFLMSHIIINIGMNMGLLPITGIPLPFISYGGSHLVIEFAALGILASMRNYSRATHSDDTQKEFIGLEKNT